VANKYTILSNYAAPERDISTHTFEDFVDISWLNKSLLKDWFTDYRYDAEVEQGESYYNQSIEKEIEYPDGSTNKIDIPVVLSYCDTHSFDEEVECELKKLKDGEILIKAEMEWTGGNWNSFSIELDESEKFEPKKIEATGYLGMVVGYDYNGTRFKNNEDWMLNEGYINLNVFLKFDNQVHELDLNDINKKLEKNNIEIDSSNSKEILSFIKDNILSKEQKNHEKETVKDGPHKTFFEDLEDVVCEEGFQKNGKWDGPYKSYHNNGELNFEGNYKEGIRVGRWKVYGRTTPYIEKQGFKGGLIQDFHYKENYDSKDHEILSSDEHSKLNHIHSSGILHGAYKDYYYNGNVDTEGSFVHGKRDGLWKKYSFQGELKTEEQYKVGKLI